MNVCTWNSSNKNHFRAVFHDDQNNYGDEENLDEQAWLLMDWNDRGWRPPNKGLLNSCLAHLCDPNHRPYRYMIAFLVAFIQGVLSFTIELPAGLQSTIVSVMKMDNTHYGVIFAAYSWADIVMSLVGTVIVNTYLGLHRGFVIFMAIVLFGQLWCAVGCYLSSFWIFLLGRLIIGCGNGTTTSILSAFQIIWFKGKEVAFAMSLSRITCRLFATIALFCPQVMYDALSPLIASPFFRLGTTQLAGILMCVLGLCSVVGTVVLDKYGAKMIGRKSQRLGGAGKSINLLDAFSFPLSFWVVATSISIFFGVLLVFTATGPLYFVNKYGLGLYFANLANSLSYTAAIFFSPVISILIDLTGYNLLWGYSGLMLSIAACVLYLAGNEYILIPFVGAFILSVGFTVHGSSIWVTPGYIVKPHQITTAYGIAMSMVSFFVGVFGICAGVIIDNFGYFIVICLNMMCFFFISGLLLLLFISEMLSEKRVLNVCGRERQKNS